MLLIIKINFDGIYKNKIKKKVYIRMRHIDPFTSKKECVLLPITVERYTHTLTSSFIIIN